MYSQNFEIGVSFKLLSKDNFSIDYFWYYAIFPAKEVLIEFKLKSDFQETHCEGISPGGCKN